MAAAALLGAWAAAGGQPASGEAPATAGPAATDLPPRGAGAALRAPRSGDAGWRLEPSLAFDALCFLNVLTGDPFYLRYYEKEYALFSPGLTGDAKNALAELKRIVKDEGGGIISARLTLYFSVLPVTTVADLEAALARPAALRDGLRRTPYWSEAGWQEFERIREPLATTLAWLREAGFPQWWRREIVPTLERRIETLRVEIDDYDILPAIQGVLGFPLPSDVVYVYVLHFTQPHGIRVTGTRFLTHPAWPSEIVLGDAVHELLHPPYRPAREPELRDVLERLREDAFLVERFENHDPSFGYNAFEGFVEEDVVQAVEQRLSERLGFAENPRERWRAADGGMHVLAGALYVLMRQEGFPGSGETISEFLVRVGEAGRLAPGRIRPLWEELVGPGG